MKKILASTLMLFTFFAEASSDMKIYSFTADFVQCVSQYESEEYDYSVPGRMGSALMNGESALPSGPLGSEYWGYMDCLSKARGGTSNEGVDRSLSCGEVDISTSNGNFYIPPGQEGKKIGVNGYFWECSSGQWSRISPSNAAGSQTGIDDLRERPQDCGIDTFSQERCTFRLEETKHRSFTSSDFGPINGHNSDYEGHLVAICRDGNFEVVESFCEPTSCQPGEIVSWSGEKNEDGRTGFCESQVGSNGIAVQQNEEIKYYSSENRAIEKTRVTQGRAKFVCSKGRWVLSEHESSTCSVKPKSELSCFSESLGGEQRKYYCE